MKRRRPLSSRSGFTLVEAMVSTSIMVISGSALLLGVSSALQTTTYSLDQTIAIGMAEQLMDEIAGSRFADTVYEISQSPSLFGPAVDEEMGQGRELYDDVDDFHGFTAGPPQDLWGVAIGTDDGEGDSRHPDFQIASAYFRHYRQEVRVYYVDDNDPAVEVLAAPWSSLRAVEVNIYYDDPIRGSRPLASLHRIFAYVPEP